MNKKILPLLVFLCSIFLIAFGLWGGMKPEKPRLSIESGFYSGPFTLQITSSGHETIYYTLDGSDPLVHGVEYKDPILVYDRSNEEAPAHAERRTVYDWYLYDEDDIDTYIVDRCFTVNAVSVDPYGRASEEAIGNYFIDKDQYNGMVISIVADRDALFGENGISVTGAEYDKWVKEGMISAPPLANFDKSGRQWEIPAYINVFENGELSSEQKIGLRIQGGESRAYQFKRYSLYSRREYSGSDFFSLDFFGDNIPIHSVTLRPTLADAIFPALIEGRDVIGCKHIPVTLFLNGEYWRETYLSEKYSAEYFYNHFGIAKNDIIALKNGEIDLGRESDLALYDEIYKYLDSHDMSTDEAYQGFSKLVDIQNYIEYCCINLYAANLDFDETKNTYIWRTRSNTGEGYKDGRWRWGIYDIDALDWERPGMGGVDDKAKINTFTAQPPYLELPFNDRPIFSALMKNQDFRNTFNSVFLDMMKNDFSVDHIKEVLSQYNEDISVYDYFFIKRADYMTLYLKDELDRY